MSKWNDFKQATGDFWRQLKQQQQATAAWVMPKIQEASRTMKQGWQNNVIPSVKASSNWSRDVLNGGWNNTKKLTKKSVEMTKNAIKAVGSGLVGRVGNVASWLFSYGLVIASIGGGVALKHVGDNMQKAKKAQTDQYIPMILETNNTLAKGIKPLPGSPTSGWDAIGRRFNDALNPAQQTMPATISCNIYNQNVLDEHAFTPQNIKHVLNCRDTQRMGKPYKVVDGKIITLVTDVQALLDATKASAMPDGKGWGATGNIALAIGGSVLATKLIGDAMSLGRR
jgi:hypothetical protein